MAAAAAGCGSQSRGCWWTRAGRPALAHTLHNHLTITYPWPQNCDQPTPAPPQTHPSDHSRGPARPMHPRPLDAESSPASRSRVVRIRVVAAEAHQAGPRTPRNANPAAAQARCGRDGAGLTNVRQRRAQRRAFGSSGRRGSRQTEGDIAAAASPTATTRELLGGLTPLGCRAR